MRLLYWIVTALTLGIYATMLVWTLPAISAAADGLAPFDMRPGGYTFDEAKTFLAALSPEGRALYLGPQHWLDLAYPPLLAMFTAWTILLVSPKRLGRWRSFLAALAIPGMVFDYLENGAVAAMLEAGAQGLTADMAGFASRMTLLKSVCVSLSLCVLLLLFFHFLWRRYRPASA